jgi:hypothetical protein
MGDIGAHGGRWLASEIGKKSWSLFLIDQTSAQMGNQRPGHGLPHQFARLRAMAVGQDLSHSLRRRRERRDDKIAQ